MENLKNREHDFSSKLRQDATIERLKKYILWQRNCKGDVHYGGIPNFSPISINLDLTSSCNFSCPFCVDSKLTNMGKSLSLEDVRETIVTLHSHGLLSVILIGGGEPTLHKDFEEIVRYTKGKKLQVGIVTNGSRMERIEGIIGLLREKDWVRISIDAAEQKTFKDLHLPKTKIALDRILEKAKKVKEKNPTVSLGYSFVIVWEGVEIHGNKLKSNIDEMAKSVELAREFSFDYVSFKPCLIRQEASQRETLLERVDQNSEEKIVNEIKKSLQRAERVANHKIRVLPSLNLKAMLNKEVSGIKKQPKRCHMQFFRTVVTPFGIFHCPALRGVEEGKIGESDGYRTKFKFDDTLKKTAESIWTFEAERECETVGCFYNQVNWWLEHFIHSKRDIDEIESVGNDNFFL